MNDLKTLFQDIKNIFKEEGVDTTDTKEDPEATIKAEETKEQLKIQLKPPKKKWQKLLKKNLKILFLQMVLLQLQNLMLV